MIALPSFAYTPAGDLDEAVSLLARHGDAARLLAGGTELLPRMKRRQDSPELLVGLRRVPELRGISELQRVSDPPTETNGLDPSGGTRIGASTTLHALTTDPMIQRRLQVLADAAALVATPQLRRMGTLGGNLCQDTRCTFFDQSAFWRASVGGCLKCEGTLCRVAPGSDRCWAICTSDLAPPLIALGASAHIVGPAGSRVISLEDLYRTDGLRPVTLAPDELLVDVRIPSTRGAGGAFLKLRPRRSFDYSSLGVAVVLRAEDGRVAEASIVLGAVASQPVRARSAEQLLIDQAPTPDVLTAVAESAFSDATPVANADMVPLYRRHMVRHYVAEAVRQAWDATGS